MPRSLRECMVGPALATLLRSATIVSSSKGAPIKLAFYFTSPSSFAPHLGSLLQMLIPASSPQPLGGPAPHYGLFLWGGHPGGRLRPFHSVTTRLLPYGEAHQFVPCSSQERQYAKDECYMVRCRTFVPCVAHLLRQAETHRSFRIVLGLASA